MAIVSGGGGAALPAYFSVSGSAPAAAFAVNADGGVQLQQATDTFSPGTLNLKELAGQGSAILNFENKTGGSIGYFDAPDAYPGGFFQWNGSGRFSGPLIVGSGLDTRVITSGALPTVTPVSGTAFQCSTARDIYLLVPVTYNPGVATTATCKVELSPDNVTFSTLITITKPVGTVFDGSIEPVALHAPANWYVKLTVTNATLGTGTYY